MAGAYCWRMVRARPPRPEDWPAVAAIFAEGIATGRATFETEAPSWEAWDEAHLAEHRLVAELDGEIAGWAAVVPYSRRARRRGVGRALLEALVENARAGKLWTLQAGIFPDNVASLELHRRVGFRQVGVRERIGRLDGVWRDVVLLELRL